MAKTHESYELMVVYSLKDGEESAKALAEKFQGRIESLAALENVEDWGKRRLAYPIKYQPDGYYVIYTYTSSTDVPMEIERILNINDGVLRFLTTMR